MCKKKIVCVVLALVFFLTSCNQHQHTFLEEWSFNETTHWKNASCEHNNEKKSLTNHTFIDEECECGMLYGLEFSLKSDNTYAIVKYSGNKDHITLPKYFNNLPVTSIESKAFYNASLISIRIPNGVTIIKDKAFRMCEKLESVSLPDGLITIENSAFENCINLTNINFPNTLATIGNAAFSSCKNLINIILPNSLTVLGESSFAGCENLKTITLSNQIKVLEAYLFHKCDNLTEIKIPNSVKTIKDNVFSYCWNLSKVYIPSSVKEVGNNIFEHCSNVNIYCEHSKRPFCWNNVEFTFDGRHEEWADYWDGWGSVIWNYTLN